MCGCIKVDDIQVAVVDNFFSMPVNAPQNYADNWTTIIKFPHGHLQLAVVLQLTAVQTTHITLVWHDHILSVANKMTSLLVLTPELTHIVFPIFAKMPPSIWFALHSNL